MMAARNRRKEAERKKKEREEAKKRREKIAARGTAGGCAKQLRTLYVDGCEHVTNAFADVLPKLCMRLKTIDLQQGQIGVEGGRAIADALRVNGTLMNLKLCTPPYADRTRGTRLRLTHARFPPPWRQTTTV